MDRIEVKVDPEEIPKRGYSAVRVTEDEHGYYSYGSGNMQTDDRPIVIADLKNIGLHIEGGETFKRFIENNKDEMGWADCVLSYTLRFLMDDGSLESVLLDMLDLRHKAGFKAGQYNLRNYFRRGLNLDHDPDNCDLAGREHPYCDLAERGHPL